MQLTKESMTDKSSLRRTLLAARNSFSAELRARMDAALVARVLDWAARHPPKLLGVYWPIRGEPDLRAAYATLQKRGVQLALPAVDGADQPLRFLLWTPDSVLEKDRMGVMAPAAGTFVQPDALLIPCVGWNATHHRLGYGGGFYDRTLAALPRPLAIGIAYASARCVFDNAPHDQALDAVITESTESTD